MILEFREDRNRPPLALPHFPTQYQAVIWRNWGLIPVDRLAAVLGAAAEQIRAAARKLGLVESSVKLEPLWLERGYITIIRANWHLLPLAQLQQLLGWTEERLAFALKEDDFLWIKLGSVKPWVETVKYRKLTPEEREQTRRMRAYVVAHFTAASDDAKKRNDGMLAAGRSDTEHGWAGQPVARPFDFLKQYKKVELRRNPAREPGEDEIRLDLPWSVVFPSGKPLIAAAVERFVIKHEQTWGARWQYESGDGPEAGNGPLLRISLMPDRSRSAESHALWVNSRGIEISAVDEAGAMRALQWLSGQMERSGAPYISVGEYDRNTVIDTRILYSYSAVFGDPLLEPELDPFPEELLERLSELGVNGVWLQSVLYNLVPWEIAPELSENWEKRIAGLRHLIAKTARYGIGVYLYCNEPRSMPVGFFDDKPQWKGHVTDDGQAMLCTPHPDVRRMLSSAISRLFREAPDLAGLINISMSENWTHCYSRTRDGKTNCPRCRARTPGEVTTEVIRSIAEGAFAAKPDARILCWTWAWSPELGWTEDDYTAAVDALPDRVTVMCTSENAIPTSIGGISGSVNDYAMSIVGPGEKALRTWRAAERRGLRTAAKVQLNNTWECSAVPFLPVFQLIEQHLIRLDKSGVSALMLSWTLGGYPSPNLELAAEYYWETKNIGRADSGASQPEDSEKPHGIGKCGIRELLQGKFGDKAGRALEAASAAFSQAFREFPFDINVLYVAPQNYGPVNLLHLQPTGQTASMIGFPYDDLAGWRAIYPESVFASQFRRLSGMWRKGLQQLAKARKFVPVQAAREFADLETAATAAYLHFHSTHLQIAFVRTRNRYRTAKRADIRLRLGRRLMDIVRAETGNVRRLHALVARDSRIGFEASNHYYYTTQDLWEKELNCAFVLEQLRREVAANDFPSLRV